VELLKKNILLYRARIEETNVKTIDVREDLKMVEDLI
jgi:hypothetical protein